MERREKKRKRRDAEATAKMTEEEKVEQEDLQEMIKKIRARNQAKRTQGDEEFQGFED